MSKPLGMLGVLKKFFGYREGDGLAEFRDEMNELNLEEKTELSNLAAKEMNMTQDQVNFPLA